MGAQMACQQTFLALGQAKISVFLALLRKVILLIPLAILLPKLGMGTDGLFYAEPIADLIAKQDDITVIKVKDYIKNPKPNGYRSYHMIVEIPVFFSKGKTPMRAEIQIRTNGMDFWATLEHQLRYKQNIEEMDGYEEVSTELLNCARAVIDMDNEMQRIKDKIGQFHDI